MSLTKRCIAEGIRLVDSRDILASEILELENQLQACEEELRREDRYALHRRVDGLRLMLSEKRVELRRLNGLVQAETLPPGPPPSPGDLVREVSGRTLEVVDVLEDGLRCRIPPELRQEGDDRAAFIITGDVEIVQRWEDRPKLTKPERPRKVRQPTTSDSKEGQLGLF